MNFNFSNFSEGIVENTHPTEKSIKIENSIIYKSSDDIEQRILEFLEKNSIEMVNPGEKIHEYCEKRKNSVIVAFSSNTSENDIAAIGMPKHKKPFNLSCPLYKRRK